MATFGDVIHGLKNEFSTPSSMIDGHAYHQSAIHDAIDHLAKLGGTGVQLDPLQTMAAEILLARLPNSMTGRREASQASTFA